MSDVSPDLTTSQDGPEFIEARVVIHACPMDRVFAFGSAIINGEPRIVFVGFDGHSVKKHYGYWKRNRRARPLAIGDLIEAKISTRVAAGENFNARYWQVITPALKLDRGHVVVDVVIHKCVIDRGFSFGAAIINGARSEVFVPAYGHSTQDPDGFWKKTGNEQPPREGDVIHAKVVKRPMSGKNPLAEFWKFVSRAPEPELAAVANPSDIVCGVVESGIGTNACPFCGSEICICSLGNEPWDMESPEDGCDGPTPRDTIDLLADRLSPTGGSLGYEPIDEAESHEIDDAIRGFNFCRVCDCDPCQCREVSEIDW